MALGTTQQTAEGNFAQAAEATHAHLSIPHKKQNPSKKTGVVDLHIV